MNTPIFFMMLTVVSLVLFILTDLYSKHLFENKNSNVIISTQNLFFLKKILLVILILSFLIFLSNA
jgi:hypothetical protein